MNKRSLQHLESLPTNSTGAKVQSLPEHHHPADHRIDAVHPLSPLFNPRSVAVVGASENPAKLGRVLLNNLIEYGYRGTIRPINPRAAEILGYPAYAAVADVPEPVDVALISIPNEHVLASIRDCAGAGVKGAVILSSGFGEMGRRGKEVEAEIAALARDSGMRIVGPNCMGVYNAHAAFNGTYFWDLPRTPGRLGVLSQSGAYGGMLFRDLISRGIGVSTFVSIGNQLDLSHAEALDYLAGDPQTEVVALVIEELKQGKEFVATARRLAGRKPLVAFKVGRTAAGQRAVQSHTGSIAGRAELYEAAFRSCGVIGARDTEEFFDLIAALTTCGGATPAHRGVAIVTVSGGPCVAASDACELLGLEVPELRGATLERVRSLITDFGAARNPVDMTPQTDPANYAAVVEAVLADSGIGGLIAINVGLDLEPFGAACAAGKAKHRKPVVAFTLDTPKINALLKGADIPIFATPERAVQAYQGLVRFGAIKGRAARHAAPAAG